MKSCSHLRVSCRFFLVREQCVFEFSRPFSPIQFSLFGERLSFNFLEDISVKVKSFLATPSVRSDSAVCLAAD